MNAMVTFMFWFRKDRVPWLSSKALCQYLFIQLVCTFCGLVLYFYLWKDKTYEYDQHMSSLPEVSSALLYSNLAKDIQNPCTMAISGDARGIHRGAGVEYVPAFVAEFLGSSLLLFGVMTVSSPVLQAGSRASLAADFQSVAAHVVTAILMVKFISGGGVNPTVAIASQLSAHLVTTTETEMSKVDGDYVDLSYLVLAPMAAAVVVPLVFDRVYTPAYARARRCAQRESSRLLLLALLSKKHASIPLQRFLATAAGDSIRISELSHDVWNSFDTDATTGLMSKTNFETLMDELVHSCDDAEISNSYHRGTRDALYLHLAGEHPHLGITEWGFFERFFLPKMKQYGSVVDESITKARSEASLTRTVTPQSPRMPYLISL